MVIALIPAAGSSSRMGGALATPGSSKALIEIDGKTVIRRSVEAVLSDPRVKAVCVLVPESLIEVFRMAGLPDEVVIRAGGATRMDSVAAGLDWACSLIKSREAEYILIHDGARCCLSTTVLSRVIDEALVSGAATAGVPVTDSLVKRSGDGLVAEYVDRSTIWGLRTPQVFRFSLIERGHELAKLSHFEATDDSVLVSKFHPISVVMGDRFNIKVTTPEDLQYAEFLISKGVSLRAHHGCVTV